MGWDATERQVGRWVAIAVLVAGVVLGELPGGPATWVGSGMTVAEVEAAFGSEGRQHPTKFHFISGPHLLVPGEAERHAEWLRKNSHIDRVYGVGGTEVEVEFFGVRGDERVVSVASARSFRLGGFTHLACWVGGAVACGWVAALLVRMRRPPYAAPAQRPAGEAARL